MSGGNSCDEEHNYPKASFGNYKHVKQQSHLQKEVRKSLDHDEYEEDSAGAMYELFHGFLAIGTLGSEASTTPTFAISVENITEKEDEVTENELNQIKQLDLETNPTVLVNTFEALEEEALRAIDKINMIPIGPLIPSAFLDGNDPTDTSFGGDIFQVSNDYVEWLDSKEEDSVVYVSFGSYFELSKRQMEEIARGLLDCGRPFLWVVREKVINGKKEEEEELCCFREELEKWGKIVTWCSQVEVLSHSSVGCFLTHCGWNSTMESLVSGVPMVAFPQWTDQMTNAKLIEDVWKIGVRVDHHVNANGIVEGKEIEACLDVVMGSGDRASEFRKNAKKWKVLARDAAKEGGSSEKNLRAFVDDVRQKFMHTHVGEY